MLTWTKDAPTVVGEAYWVDDPSIGAYVKVFDAHAIEACAKLASVFKLRFAGPLPRPSEPGEQAADDDEPSGYGPPIPASFRRRNVLIPARSDDDLLAAAEAYLPNAVHSLHCTDNQGPCRCGLSAFRAAVARRRGEPADPHAIEPPADDLLAAAEAVVAKLDYLRGLWGDEAITRRLADDLRTAVARRRGEQKGGDK